MKNRLSGLLALAFLVMCLQVTFNMGKWKHCNVLHFDMAGYHLYMPAIFIYNDIRELKYYSKVDSTYQLCPGFDHYAQYKNKETGYSLNKYPCGVAVFQLPASLMAMGYTYFTKQAPMDGYSAPFQLAVALSTILFSFLGLLVLRNFLLRYISDFSTAIALLIIAVGTNLYHYTAVDPGLSHVYLFFLYAVILNVTDKWYKQASMQLSIYLGLALGMAIITRPTDILIIFIPLLWRIHELKQTLQYLKKNIFKIVIALIFFFLPVMLQISYWKYITGHWIYFSYEEEYFDFLHPHIIEGLFSFRKGWFVYTPLAMLGFIGMIYMLLKNNCRFYLTPVIVYYSISIFVIFSWSMWYYGGGFGSRVMLQSLALLALPIGILTEAVVQTRLKILMSIYFTLIVAGIGLNLFQSAQYARGIIHWDSMNEAYYWRIFGKMKITEEDKESLFK